MEIKNHLLIGARFVPSPNYNDRPLHARPELIVIHSISLPPAKFGGPYIEQFFQNQLPADAHPYFQEIHQMQVSAHLLIRRDGEIVQFVPFDKRAWHAGKSRFQERENCNDFSIGIELEGTEDSPFEVIQYDRLKQVIECLQSTYAIPHCATDQNAQTMPVVGHSEIAPGRKFDPGICFDWSRFR